MTTQLDFFGKSYTDGKQADLFVAPAPSVGPVPEPEDNGEEVTPDDQPVQ